MKTTNTRHRYIALVAFVVSVRASLVDGESTRQSLTAINTLHRSEPTDHDICVRARYGKRKPKTKTLQEAFTIGADKVAHDTAIQARDGDTEHGPEDEEGSMGKEYECLLRAICWKCNA